MAAEKVVEAALGLLLELVEARLDVVYAQSLADLVVIGAGRYQGGVNECVDGFPDSFEVAFGDGAPPFRLVLEEAVVDRVACLALWFACALSGDPFGDPLVESSPGHGFWAWMGVIFRDDCGSGAGEGVLVGVGNEASRLD